MSLPRIKTEEEVNKSMLGNIPDEYEKSTGFLTGDLVKTNSIEMSEMYKALEKVVEKFDAENLEGEELTKFVNDRKGVKRKEATPAKVELTIEGQGVRIKIGDLFATKNNITFASVEDKEISGIGTVKAECTQAGRIGMVGAFSITEMPITISGITSITNEKNSYDGFDEETDKSLRERYYIALRTPATSGNIYHYRQWALEVAGVGKVKVFPLWNGDNTVQVLIIDGNRKPASAELVETVQNYIDPKGEKEPTGKWTKWGGGYGEAPVGAYCTVSSATQKDFSVSVDVDLAMGHEMEDVKTDIKNKLIDYFKSIAFEKDYVSNAVIGSAIIGVEGVIDYKDLKINGVAAANIPIGEKEVAVLNELVVS